MPYLKSCILILTLGLLSCHEVSGQWHRPGFENQAVSFGWREGGKDIIGMEYEIRVAGAFGALVGVGLTSMATGITYHFNPREIESNFLSLEYNQVKFGKNMEYWGIGPFYNFRKVNITGSFGYLFRTSRDGAATGEPKFVWDNGAFSFSLGFYVVFK